MKLFIILSVVACSYAAKLDRTYLPPASASTAGGSPGSITAPGASGQLTGPSGLGQPTGQSAISQPSGSPFGQLSSSTGFGQPSGSAGFGQPSGSAGLGKTTGNAGFNEPSAPSGFGQTPGMAVFGQQSGQSGPSQPIGQASFGQTPFPKSSSPSFSQFVAAALEGNNQQSGPSSVSAPSANYGQPIGSTNFGKISPSFGASAQPNQETQSFGQAPIFGQDAQAYQPERARASIDRGAEILRYDNQNDGETFAYAFETSNGISAEESGVATNGVQAQGSFSYTDDDGQQIRITYTADENGYQPQGDHLPTPPPIPEEILRSIEENARAAAAGTQEGAYNPNEDVAIVPQQYNNGGAPSYPGATTYQGAAQGSQQSNGPFGSSKPAGALGQAESNQPNRYTANSGLNNPVGATGYDYNKPQGSTGRTGSSEQPSGQYNGAASPNSQSGPANRPGQYSPATSPNSQGNSPFLGSQGSSSPFGGNPSQINGFSKSSPSSLGTGTNQPSAQGFGPSKSASSQYNGFSGPQSSPTNFGSGLNQPSGQGLGPSKPGFTNQPQGYSSDSSSQPSGPQGLGQSGLPGPKSMQIQSAPYQYNRPSDRGAQVDGRPGTQQPGFSSSPSGGLGSPRQPPSFSSEEGYKY
ncbi:pupal cuticle protein 36-like [Bombyx mandarina]|uniref:Pupal cuticle protein 36-like n=1 Tax=Bombyx mandarina TaxID=7092 RepID=A0A6J2KF67_BOMMA|nr:pupal cuticle protein 36-like [Bombyx mandarina]